MRVPDGPLPDGEGRELFWFYRLPTGRYEILIQQHGYQEERRVVEVSPASVDRLGITLAARQ